MGDGILSQNFSLNPTYLVAIIAGMMWALFLVLAKKSELDFFAAVGVALLIGALIMGGHLIATKSLVWPVGTQWLYLIILGIAPTALGPVAWVVAMKKAKKVAQIASFEYFTPMLGVLLSWIFLRENINAYLIVGLGIILLSVFLNARKSEA